MTAGLIGLGAIAKHYYDGLQASSFLKLCAVSDMDAKAASRAVYDAYPFYTDYKEMLQAEKPDMVIICTPPQSHFDIALYCLEHHTDVLMEKPVTLHMEEFDTLCAVAEKNGRTFKTMFHWQNGIELFAFNRTYPVNDIREISVSVQDPYSEDETTISPTRRALMGTWVDSGVNVLSMIKTWLPFENVQILHTETVKCTQTDLPLYVRAKLQIDGVTVTITVDWRCHRNYKETVVKFADKSVRICHTDQSIVDGETVMQYARMPRLDEHYYAMFTHMDQTSNAAQSRLVHQVLLEVNKTL